MADRISHYRLGARLGRGAMGVVYRAVDERLGRPVALKLLPIEQAGSHDMQARMLREAQAASALNHPGIVTVHDIGAFKGQLFIVMELVDGESFSELARRIRPTPPGKKPSFSGAFRPSAEEAVRLTALAADALGVAHDRQILHRDVKSDNLMRTRDGRVKVLDFGLAKRPLVVADGGAPDGSAGWGGGEGSQPPVEDGWVLPAERSNQEALAETLVPSNTPAPSLNDANSSPWTGPSSPGSGVTHAGALVGTPAYMAPEQTQGAPADARSEVFSLGVVLYELLTGNRPFDRAGVDDTMQAIRTAEPAPPSQASPERGITPAVDAVVLRALAKDREARHPDMAAFAAALRAAVAPPRRSAAILVAAGKPRRLLVATAGFAAALLLGAAALAFVALRRGKSGPPFSVTATKRLTYEPGCEGYPSFTPDAQTIVYDGLIDGDYELFAMDVATGKLRRLTNRPGWDYGAVVSPDGKWVAFVRLSERGREVAVMSIEGEGAEGARSMGGAMSYTHWTADGGLVYVERGGNILRWDFPTGGKPVSRSLGSVPPTVDVHDVAAFTDGYVFIGGTDNALAASELFGEVPRGGAWRELERTPLAAHAGMTITPREDAVYYAHSQEESGAAGGELLRRGRDGSLARLSSPIKPAAGLDISAAGDRLVYSTCREYAFLGRLRPGEQPVELLPRSELRDETPMALDASHVLFTSNRSGRPQVWTIDLRTGKAAAFAGPGTRDASTSPDGRWVAYAASEGRGLAIVPATGGPERVITDDPTDAAPRFSHDGGKLVFQRTSKDGQSVWVVPVQGGKPERIAPWGASRPVASPVDDRVLYLLTCAEGFEVQSTTLSGAPPEPVADLEPASWSEPRFSKDGKRILIVRQKTEVLEVPLDGSSPPVVRWQADQEGVDSVDWAPDGDGLIAAVAVWDGDIWLAEGRFH